MKIEYGKERSGHVVADISHKWNKYLTIADRATMVIKRVIKTYPDASSFDWYVKDGTSDICACRFNT